jgi:signal transduction histidine kinase
VSHRLLAAADDQTALHDIADSVRELTMADIVGILLPATDDPGLLVLEVVSGLGAQELQGLRVPLAGSQVQRVMQEQRLQVLHDFNLRLSDVAELRSLPDVRHIVAVPLQGAKHPRGAIVAARMSDIPFSAADLGLAEGFVSQAGLALELADRRADSHQLAMLEDRARIASDLHDHVVRKLFAAGLALQGTATMVRDVALRRQLTAAVDNLDDTIRTIRASIFELQMPHLPAGSVRHRVLRVLCEMTSVLGFPPQLAFEESLDSMADVFLGHEVEAVLRESLTNVAKHAQASAVEVGLATEGRLLHLSVADDGVGLRGSVRRSGLSNLRRRAESRGGRLELSRAPAGGLLLRWTIPLPE